MYNSYSFLKRPWENYQREGEGEFIQIFVSIFRQILCIFATLNIRMPTAISNRVFISFKICPQPSIFLHRIERVVF
jgi:hypothetical protein